MSHNLKQFIDSHQTRVNDHLTKITCSTSTAARLNDAIAYAATAPGKRLRPLLVYATAQLGQQLNDASELARHNLVIDGAASAIELIHCYSLVHDDLPAMDDDDLRRGRPTTHIAYDEPTAILVGDALQCMAFELLMSLPTDAQTRVDLATTLSQAAGSSGMVAGQQLDIDATDTAIDQQQLESIHRLKTGALISAAVDMGALVANLGEQQRAALAQYAANLGLAFQVVDDILDIESSTEQLGKQQGADQALNKSTYPKLMGITPSKDYAKQLIDDAINALALFDNRADTLRDLARFVLARKS